jgi:hypothetical protein
VGGSAGGGTGGYTALIFDTVSSRASMDRVFAAVRDISSAVWLVFSTRLIRKTEK